MPISDGDVGPRRLRNLGDAAFDGNVTIEGDLTVGDDLAVVDNTTIGGYLEVGEYVYGTWGASFDGSSSTDYGSISLDNLYYPALLWFAPDVRGLSSRAGGGLEGTYGGPYYSGAFSTSTDGRRWLTLYPETRCTTSGKPQGAPSLTLADWMPGDSTSAILWRLGIGAGAPSAGNTTHAARNIEYAHDSRLIFDGDTDTYIRHTAANALSFVVGGTTVLKMTSTGCVITT